MAMRERQKTLVRLFWRRLSILGLITLIFAAAFGVWGVFQKERESRYLRDHAQRQAYELSAQEEELSTHISKLKTDRGKEETLRAQYAIGKAGEGLIIIVEPPTPEPIQASTTMRQWVRKFLPFW